jgi:hypothetical protein
MNAKVFLQVLLFSERYLTNLTVLNTLTLVFFDVRHKRMVLKKGDATIFALVSLGRCVGFLDVLF